MENDYIHSVEMMVSELKDALQVCKNCWRYKEYLSNNDLGLFRSRCARCKSLGKKDGVYKADIVISSLNIVDKFGNTGRKPTQVKRYYLTVENLTAENNSVRKIAKIAGIGTKTVTRTQRAIKIYNFYMQGLSIDDIAIRLEISVEDVRKIISELPDDKKKKIEESKESENNDD